MAIRRLAGVLNWRLDLVIGRPAHRAGLARAEEQRQQNH